MATAIFLNLNGVDVTPASDEDVYTLVMDVAGGDLTVAEVAERLEKLDHR